MSFEKQFKTCLTYSLRVPSLHRPQLRYSHALRLGRRPSFQKRQQFVISKILCLGSGSPDKGNAVYLRTGGLRTWRSQSTATTDYNHYEAFLSFFDPYLPPSLRLQSKLVGSGGTAQIQPIQDLVRLLTDVLPGSSWKTEPLGCLGLHQNRWPAFHWLVHEMIKTQTPTSCSLAVGPLNGWATGSLSLSELTSAPSLAVKSSQRHSLNSLQQSLDSLLELPLPSNLKYAQTRSQDSLGCLWMCLGSMIIKAVDMDSEARATVMINVHQAIASMHHHDVIPRTIYNYSTAQDTSAIQRPPTLRLLRSRILTTLSDAAWTASEAQILKEAQTVGAKFVHKGHELPGAEYRPRLRSIGLETWLEFILWSCIESGRINQASWIISQIVDQQRDGKPWRVISWEALRDQTVLKDVFEMDDVRKHLVGAASTAEGYSEGRVHAPISRAWLTH